MGDAAWIIELKVTGGRGRGVILSTTKEANNYRSGLTGMYDGLEFILVVYRLHSVKDGRVKVGCV